VRWAGRFDRRRFPGDGIAAVTTGLVSVADSFESGV